MIYIDNRQSKIKVPDELNENIIKVIDFSLNDEGVKIPCEVSLLFVDNKEIKELNNIHRGIDKDTDVLSFPMLHYPDSQVYKDVYLDKVFTAEYLDDGYLVLGDIVVSLEKAKEQSLEFGHSFIREVAYLIVHSVLHLLGYDHIEEEEKANMRRREEDILKSFSIVR